MLHILVYTSDSVNFFLELGYKISKTFVFLVLHPLFYIIFDVFIVILKLVVDCKRDKPRKSIIHM